MEEADPWNFLLGAAYAFRDRWSAGFEAGRGPRQQVEISVTRRP
jgi:hypothetical protein